MEAWTRPYRPRGVSLNEEACTSLGEAFASSDEVCTSSMRHTPHQPVGAVSLPKCKKSDF